MEQLNLFNAPVCSKRWAIVNIWYTPGYRGLPPRTVFHYYRSPLSYVAITVEKADTEIFDYRMDEHVAVDHGNKKAEIVLLGDRWDDENVDVFYDLIGHPRKPLHD